ncbi:hypothetical protein J0H58_11855 [bacterium]|nr:hypothetical protein [bacterium]
MITHLTVSMSAAELSRVAGWCEPASGASSPTGATMQSHPGGATPLRQFAAMTFAAASVISPAMKHPITFALILVAILLPRQALANHGPATSAGGVTVESAEPLPEGEVALVLRENYTSYEDLTRAELEARAAAAGGFDYLDESFITTLGIFYGVTDNFDLSASIGWYSGRGFVDAEGDEHGEAGEESSVGNPTGLTDLNMRGRLRVATTSNSSFALLGGVVAPTGDRSERLSNGDTLDPSSQPGTGRFGLQGGVAFTHAFISDVKLDSSSVYTHRFERDGVRVGDRLDTGFSLALQFTEFHAARARLSLFGEFNHIWLDKDESNEGRNGNSGGTSMFFTTGLRLDVADRLSVTVAPSLPLYQDSNGDQVEVDYKLTGMLMVRL